MSLAAFTAKLKDSKRRFAQSVRQKLGLAEATSDPRYERQLELFAKADAALRELDQTLSAYLAAMDTVSKLEQQLGEQLCAFHGLFGSAGGGRYG